MPFIRLVARSFAALPKSHQICIGSAVALMMLVLVFSGEQVEASRHQTATMLEVGTRYAVELNVESTTAEASDFTEARWQTVTVKRGDTLARIFKRIGFSARDTHNVARAGEQAKKLVNLKPGEKLLYQKCEQDKFAALQYQLSPTKTLLVETNQAGEFVSEVTETPVEIRTNFAQGQIASNFWNAGVKSGLSDNLIMRLASIFGWDIDFAMEIRAGDTFNVVFEEKFIDGDFVGYGDIIAAEFINQGDTFQAVLHSDGNYYTPEGRSMRKSFLRAPVNFKYVSSNFTKARFHPVMKRWKAHRGTDYVAAVGTPIMAAGDGKVIRSGYNKYNGHHVFIKHGETYTTKYLHFKKRPSVKQGETVRQGQVIGYLGASGMVTGAHLHYEFLVDGVHRNPRTVKLPKAKPIEASQRAEFEQIAKVNMRVLNATKRVMLAMNTSKSTDNTLAD